MKNRCLGSRVERTPCAIFILFLYPTPRLRGKQVWACVARALEGTLGRMQIVSLERTPEAIAQLSELLVETVANGGSVSFMHPLAGDVAAAFWTKSLSAAEAGERVVLGALDDGH